MAKKINQSYFSHDSNARNSDRMINLRMRHGAAGYGVFFMIVERLREEADYMSVKDYNMIAFDLRVDASLVKSVVEDFGLFVFTEDGKYFYSESLRERMLMKDEKRKARSDAGKKGMEKRWKIDENITNSTENNNNVITKPPESDNKKRKEKKKDDDKSSSQKNDDDDLLKQVEEYKGQYHQEWRNNMSRKFHITEEELIEYLNDFYLEMKCREIKINKLSGVFIPWLGNRRQKNRIQNGNQQQEREDRFSRRRGTDTPSWEAKDFSETF